MAPASLIRVCDKVCTITKRSRGRKFSQVIDELNIFLRGWFNYFRLVEMPGAFTKLDSWIRRKLRCYKLKQKKNFKSLVKFLVSRGIPKGEARKLGSSGKGVWRLSSTYTVHRALDNDWFTSQGLFSLRGHSV